MPKATHRLHKLSIEEGSLVGAGDNPEAYIRLFKGKPDDEASAWARFKAWMMGDRVEPRKAVGDPMTTSQILAAGEFSERIYRVRSAFTESVWGILSLGDPAKMAPLLAKSVDEFASESQQLVDAMKARDPEGAEKLRELFDDVAAKAVAACKADVTADDSPERTALQKACADLEAFAPKPSTPKEGDMPATTKTADEIIKSLPEAERVALQAHVDAQVAAATKAKPPEAPPAPAPAPAPVAKSEAEVALEKRLADAEKKAADADARVAKIEDAQRLESFVSKARGLGLPDPEKLGLVLKNAYARSDDDGKALEQALVAASEQTKEAQKIITRAPGSSTVVTKGSPLDQLNGLAAEIKKGAPTLSTETAFTKACEARPDLYDALSNGAAQA